MSAKDHYINPETIIKYTEDYSAANCIALRELAKERIALICAAAKTPNGA